jgi:hypothetical protein
MREFIGFGLLAGALFFGVSGWSMRGEDGYEKLLALFMLMGAVGLLLAAFGVLRESRNPGVARAAGWLFWILGGLLVLLSLSERFGGG